MKTIESPGVQITERDATLRATLPVGTNTLVVGYSPQGPVYETINTTSISELEQIYGIPTNVAERYFYHTCKQVLQSPANLLTVRLPYGYDTGDAIDSDYTALLFPVSACSQSSVTTPVSPVALYSAISGYVIGQPQLIKIKQGDLDNWNAGAIPWSLSTTNIGNWTTTTEGSSVEVGEAGFVVVNKIKTTLDDVYQGYYFGIVDNGGVLPTDHDSILGIKVKLSDTSTAWSSINSSNISFGVTGNFNSVSEEMDGVPSFDITNSFYNDTVIMGLYRLRTSIYNDTTNILTKVPMEFYTGSFNNNKMVSNPAGGAAITDFIENKVNSDSVFMKMIVNPNFARSAGWMNGNTYGGSVRVYTTGTSASNADNLYCIGRKTQTYGLTENQRIVGSIPGKLDVALRLVENKDEVPIDIVCEAGLGTLWVAGALSASTDTKNTLVFKEYADYTATINTPLNDQSTGSTSNAAVTYRTIYNAMEQFCSQTRQDCIFIADPLRHIFIKGENTKILADISNNFSSNVYWPLKNLYGASNSNYAATYGNWVKIYDSANGKYVWSPMSGFVANIMATTSARLFPWTAPAGLNNGILKGISDIAINPTQKQRDLLYRVSINPVCYFPGDGFTVWGQKTLQKKPSAFDRINIRRLFLTLEKATYVMARYFVMEPNTVFTRTQLTNILTPLFDNAKNNDGIYNYAVICDESNNTQNIIDDNTMKVSIYIQPVRTAEFILVEFVATRTGTNFSEVV